MLNNFMGILNTGHLLAVFLSNNFGIRWDYPSYKSYSFIFDISYIFPYHYKIRFYKLNKFLTGNKQGNFLSILSQYFGYYHFNQLSKLIQIQKYLFGYFYILHLMLQYSQLDILNIKYSKHITNN